MISFLTAFKAGKTLKFPTLWILAHLIPSHCQSAMAKAKSKKRQQGIQNGGPTKKVKQATIISPPPEEEPSSEPQSLHSVVPTEDFEIAIDTLNSLAEHPKLIKSKACRELRTAVYEFRQACTTGFNASGRCPCNLKFNLTWLINGLA